MTTRLLVAALAATASLAACGADDPTPTSGATGHDAERKAMLDYARCIRDHGVAMPDPQFDGGHVTQKGPKNVNPAKLHAADKACASIRDKIKPPEISDEKKAEFKKAALANARCVREHGIDFPDPTFDENGGAQIKITRGSGLDPDSPKFQAAANACRGTLPGGGSDTTDADG